MKYPEFRAASLAGYEHYRQRAISFGQIGGLYNDVLIIGRSSHVRSVVRAALGHRAAVREAHTILNGLDHVLEKSPDVVCVDDPPATLDVMLEALRLLRRANYSGPIVVLACGDAKVLRGALKGQDRIDVLYRDEFNGLALLDSLLRLSSTL